MNNEDIVSRSIKIISEQFGNKYGEKLREIFLKDKYGEFNLSYNCEAVQIKIMNEFWRELLSNIPNTTFIRTWLMDSDSIDSYLNDFRNTWSKEIINIGVLDG